MRKIHILGLALFAAFAFAAVTSSAAFAEHQWLDLSNKAITEVKPALTDGLLELHHKLPAILGGGTIIIHCTGQFHGTVGPLGTDLIELILGLLSTEIDLVKCTVLQGVVGCEAGATPELHPTHLPWLTKLVLIEGVTYDEILEDPVQKAGEPGYTTECGSFTITCTSPTELSRLVGSTETGSEFAFEEKKVAKCTDGGTGTITSKEGITLDFFASHT